MLATIGAARDCAGDCSPCGHTRQGMVRCVTAGGVGGRVGSKSHHFAAGQAGGRREPPHLPEDDGGRCGLDCVYTIGLPAWIVYNCARVATAAFQRSNAVVFILARLGVHEPVHQRALGRVACLYFGQPQVNRSVEQEMSIFDCPVMHTRHFQAEFVKHLKPLYAVSTDVPSGHNAPEQARSRSVTVGAQPPAQDRVRCI